MRAKAHQIDYPLVAKGHTPMYDVHKYWARKPHNIVAEYVTNYSKEGDIVLDPFCGSGVTPIEAIKHGRKGIGIDLNPMAIFISRQTAIPADIDTVEAQFLEISSACKGSLGEMYQTKCEQCGTKATVLATTWDRQGNEPIDIRYECPICKKRNIKKPTKADKALLKEIQKTEVPYWYPKDKIPSGDVFDQGRREGGEYFADLFTRRNLIALSCIYNEIGKIKDQKLLDLFTFAFTSMVHLAAKFGPIRPSRPYSCFWPLPSYWVPPKHMECNAWLLFESAVIGRQGLIKAKKDSNDQITRYIEAEKFDDLRGEANILLKKDNALELTRVIPEDSIDYVFADPPYGGSIPYFELSTFWLLWLQGQGKSEDFHPDFDEEITISSHRGKDFEYYHKMLTAAFEQIYRVLKPGKWLTLTFHNTDIKVWNSIMEAVPLAGFDLEKIIYQPPPRTSSAGLLRPYGSATGDYYIRFRRPVQKKTIPLPNERDEKRYERVVVETARRIIAQRGEPTAYQYILNGIIPELDRKGVLLKGSKGIKEVMSSHLDTDFVLVDVYGDKGKVVGQRWWLKDPASIKIDLVPLHERVEKAILNVLNRKIRVGFDDIQQEIFIAFPNALTPEKATIRQALEDYAHETGDGRWELNFDVKNRATQHSEMIYYLAKLGQKANYDSWIAPDSQGQTFRGVKLSSLSLEVLPASADLLQRNVTRIKNIDVLWLKGGRIVAAFEVENTTTITEAIVRVKNISYQDQIAKVIIIPKERENLLFRKIQEPALQELGIGDWCFIFYGILESLYKESTRKAALCLGDLLDICLHSNQGVFQQARLFDEEV